MRCSFVFPEAPLMVQATIIFLFRICLGVLINLLRIHYSIYQNNGTLLGNQREENDFASELNQWCFLIWFNSFQSALRRVRVVEMWPAFHYLILLEPALHYSAGANAPCLDVASSSDGETEKLFRSWQSLFLNGLNVSSIKRPLSDDLEWPERPWLVKSLSNYCSFVHTVNIVSYLVALLVSSD